MKKKNNKGRSKGAYTTWLLFGTAVLLLLGSVAGSSQAALTYYSENYSAELRMFDIGVTLMENGKEVSWRNYTQKDDEWDEGGSALLTYLLNNQEDGKETYGEIQPGRQYEEELCVKNTGNIDQYVRVMIYRYWVDAPKEGEDPIPVEEREKRRDISPEWIRLNPWIEKDKMPSEFQGWVLDENASTKERTVLYYTGILKTGDVSLPFADKLAIDKEVAKKVTITETVDGNYKTITMTYDYDGVEFVLEIDVDAVQTHNADDAIRSAWGVDVTVDADGNLRLGR